MANMTPVPERGQPEGADPAVVTPVVDAKTGLASERTKLARFRTALAIDRTTLAWIRTALTSAAFGFGLIGVFRTIAPMALCYYCCCGRCAAGALRALGGHHRLKYLFIKA